MSTLHARAHAARVRDYAVTFTLQSRNEKTGPIPVSTTARQTCPLECPLYDICYAGSGNLGRYWRALSQTKPGQSFPHGRGGHVQTHTWQSFCAAIAQLPAGTLWRHNQAGDLPGHGNLIDAQRLAELVAANAGKRGFTYTHKPATPANLALIRHANRQGFTINLSADDLVEADSLAATGLPVAVVLPDTVAGNEYVATPAGRRVVVCPATYRDNVTCQSCQLCQRQTRKVIIGFPAHGASHRKVSAIARGESHE